jgi:hypothetical protein
MAREAFVRPFPTNVPLVRLGDLDRSSGADLAFG